MTGLLAHKIVCGMFGAAGLLAIVFAVMRGRRHGAGIAFGLGGLGILLYSGLFLLTQMVGRRAELMSLAETVRGGSEQIETGRRILTAVDPTAALEAIAVLLIMFGVGALARAADARLAEHGPGAAAHDDAEELAG